MTFFVGLDVLTSGRALFVRAKGVVTPKCVDKWNSTGYGNTTADFLSHAGWYCIRDSDETPTYCGQAGGSKIRTDQPPGGGGVADIGDRLVDHRTGEKNFISERTAVFYHLPEVLPEGLSSQECLDGIEGELIRQRGTLSSSNSEGNRVEVDGSRKWRNKILEAYEVVSVKFIP
jgi:hypothetical protein